MKSVRKVNTAEAMKRKNKLKGNKELQGYTFIYIYTFICRLFKDTVSSSDYIASNYRMINE
jgi:hypothetical protein